MMTKHKDIYIPVSCEQHSEYELAIMHQLMLQLVWRDDTGRQHIAKVMPLDIKIREKQEFLIVQSSDGEVHFIRLNKITRSNVSHLIKTPWIKT